MISILALLPGTTENPKIYVEEYYHKSEFPKIGEINKIYIDKTDNHLYRYDNQKGLCYIDLTVIGDEEKIYTKKEAEHIVQAISSLSTDRTNLH